MMWVAARGCCEPGAVTVSQAFSFTLRVTPVINYLSAEPVDA